MRRAREAGEHEGVGPGGDGLGDARLQQVHAQRPAHDRREQHEGRVLGRAHAALEEAELVDEQQREDELRGLEQHEVRRREAPRQRLLAQPVARSPRLSAAAQQAAAGAEREGWPHVEGGTEGPELRQSAWATSTPMSSALLSGACAQSAMASAS